MLKIQNTIWFSNRTSAGSKYSRPRDQPEMPIIIHISNDFPDIVAPHKTKAVERLVDGTPGFRHIVYSLNRVNGWKGISAQGFDNDRVAITYKALPKGFFWESRLREVGEFIIRDIKAKKIEPDIIEGHKFSVEGLIAEQIADYFKKPFVVDIQGDSDLKIIAVKRSLRQRYQNIADKAALIFPYAKWPISKLECLIRLDKDRVRILPVVPGIDQLSVTPVIDEPRLLTVFHLDSWNRKNIFGVLKAMVILRARGKTVRLDICRTGSVKSATIIRRKIKSLGLDYDVNLIGPAPNSELPKLMKGYAGFILPSKRESYGLVYVEALFSGLPIVLSKDRGIDGFFETERIGAAVDPFDTADIARGIMYVLEHQKRLKQSIGDLQVSGGLNFVRRDAILECYRNSLHAVLQAASQAAGQVSAK